jgi:hypothetical protein
VIEKTKNIIYQTIDNIKKAIGLVVYNIGGAFVKAVETLFLTKGRVHILMVQY